MEIPESGINFVHTGLFHHVLKFFPAEEMLQLRPISSCLQDRVPRELLTNNVLNLHENTFRETLGHFIEGAKKLKIETI